MRGRRQRGEERTSGKAKRGGIKENVGQREKEDGRGDWVMSKE